MRGKVVTTEKSCNANDKLSREGSVTSIARGTSENDREDCNEKEELQCKGVTRRECCNASRVVTRGKVVTTEKSCNANDKLSREGSVTNTSRVVKGSWEAILPSCG